MEKALPMSALRHYNDVFEELKPGVHINFTKNGVPAGTLVDTEEWERTQAEIRLLTELAKSERNFGAGIELSEFRARHKRG
jgi:PHD/YefM family antitoxin component YafN of YafNO toxin-antitoxin module